MEKVDCQSPLASKMSSAALRKIKKPIIEKRRRERINDSLNQLKSLVLDAMQKDESRYSKMEKADILEMTVHHLKDCHRQQAKPDNHTLTNKYTAGYSECANEVAQYLGGMDCMSPDLRLRIMSHLSQGLQKSVQRAATTIQAPTPIMATSAYHGSPSAMIPVSTLPCATQIASLPGSSEAQYPASISPLNLLTSSPTGMPSNVLLIHPGQISPVSGYSSDNSSPCQSPSAGSSPAHSPSSVSSSYSSSHSPSSVSGAIPLYVSPSAGRYSPVSYQVAPRHSTSPSLGDDALSRYPEEAQTTRGTVIAKNNNKLISSCNGQARMGHHLDNMAADNGSMWRPW